MSDYPADWWQHPGVYAGIPGPEYLAAPLVSQSLLKRMDAQSPAHARYIREHPEPYTDAKLVGTATHMAVFEPHLFPERFVTAPQCEEDTKGGTRCSRSATVARQEDGDRLTWFCTQHDPWKGAASDFAGPTVLSEAHAGEVARTAAAVRAHPEFQRLEPLAIGKELTVVWRDPVTELLCKSRFDMPTPEAIVDLKTTVDASEDAFRKSFERFDYGLQAAFYLRAAVVSGIELEEPRFYVIAAEKKEPNGVRFFNIHEGTIGAEIERMDRLLARWAECERTGAWPSYPATIEDLSYSDWRFRELDRETEREGVAAAW